MNWQNIEQRLAKLFREQVTFPAGTIWLPPTYFNVSDWLSQIAENEDERSVIAVRGLDFLRYRWPFEVLVEMNWDDNRATNQGSFRIEAMYVGKRAYIFLSKRRQLQVVAALEPAKEPEITSAVVKTLLSNQDAIAEAPSSVRSLRPDIIPQSMVEQAFLQRDRTSTAARLLNIRSA
jgi:hypothetical protein